MMRFHRITLVFLAALMAVFLLSGCTAVARVDQVVDRAEDRAIDAFVLAKKKANEAYDLLLLEHRENEMKLQRLGRELGRE